MVCYIILHYQVEEETVNCVNQLSKIHGEHQIIIVDNCSPNGSGKSLGQKYAGEKDIDVILNSQNEGFAKGNNLGCTYAREKYNPDFYVVMNNDIEIPQNDFQELINLIYQETKFDVLGPDIYSTSERIHQSPKSLSRTTLEGSERLLKKYERRNKSRIIVPLRCYLKKIPLLKKAKNLAGKKNARCKYGIRHINVPLHGSCVIFSGHYMQQRKEAFFPDTFFYYEMEILDYECQKEGYKEVYDPTLKVLHHQNVSTNETYASELKKVRFMNEQNYYSIKNFLNYYNR